MKSFSLILGVVVLLVPLAGCASETRKQENDAELEALNEEGWAAVQRGDFGRAIELAMPRARQGDAEFEFTVGYLQLEWLVSCSVNTFN